MFKLMDFCRFLGISKSTYYRYEKLGKLRPCLRTFGGHRRFSQKYLSKLQKKDSQEKIVIGYARVSSHDQKDDLNRQVEILKLESDKYFSFEIISDLGSGINFKKKGLLKLLKLILLKKVDKIILTHKDRLLRFGSELIFFICKFLNIEVEILGKDATVSFENQLCQDVLEILTVFSARLYGKRSRKNMIKLAKND